MIGESWTTQGKSINQSTKVLGWSLLLYRGPKTEKDVVKNFPIIIVLNDMIIHKIKENLIIRYFGRVQNGTDRFLDRGLEIFYCRLYSEINP